MSCPYPTMLNALVVRNYTGQDVNLSFIKVKSDDSGVPVLKDGKYQVSKVGKNNVIPPTADGGSTNLSNWSPDWTGYTAQTADGKYSITGSRCSSTSGPNCLTIDVGTCQNAWVGLCTSDKCVDSTGLQESSNDNFVMTVDGDYYGSGMRWGLIVILLLLIILAVVVIGGGYYYWYRKKGGFA